MTDARRILLIGHFLSRKGGTLNTSETFAATLRDTGWEVITTSSQPKPLPKLADMLLTILLRRHDYDLAQVSVYSGHAFFWAECCCWLLNRLGKPYILVLQGGNLVTFARSREARVRRLLASARAVVTPSHFLRDGLSHLRADIDLIPNGLNLRQFRPRLRTRAEPRIVWLRALHRLYNPVLAVEALALVKATSPEAQLTMFGPDKQDGSSADLRQTAERLGVVDSLTLPGLIPPEEVPDALAAFDLFLNTTNAESFGVSVVEAAALGLCIITTNVGELPYLWTDGENALLIPPGDAQAAAAAITRVLQEPGLAERLSRNARATAEQFDWSYVLPQWGALFASILEKSAS